MCKKSRGLNTVSLCFYTQHTKHAYLWFFTNLTERDETRVGLAQSNREREWGEPIYHPPVGPRLGLSQGAVRMGQEMA